MSEIKTSAIGFLYDLATDIDVRSTWPDKQPWGNYFDMSDPQTDDVIDALNLVGFIGSGQVNASEANNLLGWQVIVNSAKDIILQNLESDEPVNLPDFTAELGSYPQFLAVLLAELVYDQSTRTAFLNNPSEFMAKKNPFLLNGADTEHPDTIEQREMVQNSLIGFAEVIESGDAEQIEQYFDDNLGQAMSNQFLTEQADIW